MPAAMITGEDDKANSDSNALNLCYRGCYGRTAVQFSLVLAWILGCFAM
jgi:hypothetical protein